MLLQYSVDHDGHALYCVARCGPNDTWAQDDVRPRVTVDQTVTYFHRHRARVVQNLVGPFSICSSQMRENEFLATATVHRLVYVLSKL